MNTPHPLKLFIPAKALEHPGNGEQFTLHQKICAAVRRHLRDGTFDGPVIVEDPIPRILIEKRKFNTAEMGYDIEAKIF